ncbi:cytochrome P450 [bacterium]|nr:cytochrome P450 [bacterium]
MSTSTLSAPLVAERPLPRTAGWPLVGALPALIRNPLDYLLQARAIYGDIYELDLGVTRLVTLNHPDHAQHVLVDNARNYSKGGAIWDSLRTLLGNGLPVSEGDFWLRQRRMMQPHFHRRKLAALTDQMAGVIEDEVTNWRHTTAPGQPFDAAHAVTQITMRVIVNALFGASLGTDQVDRVAGSLSFAVDHLFQGLITQSLPALLPIPGRRRYREAVQTIDEVVVAAIEQCRHSDDDSLISMLIDMVDTESGEQMTIGQLRDEAVTMFLAGYETTANTLAWSIHFMTQQPEIQDALQAEVDTVLQGRVPTFADLPNLRYTRMILEESMRYYPPSWQLTRTALADDVIDGVAIRQGQMVAVMQHGIHHHPTFWPDPQRFDPQRFTPEAAAARPKLAWIPFGAGQRFCIGNDLAMMEGALVLAMLAQRYTLAAVPGKVAQPHIAITLRPKTGVWTTLTTR